MNTFCNLDSPNDGPALRREAGNEVLGYDVTNRETLRRKKGTKKRDVSVINGALDMIFGLYPDTHSTPLNKIAPKQIKLFRWRRRSRQDCNDTEQFRAIRDYAVPDQLK